MQQKAGLQCKVRLGEILFYFPNLSFHLFTIVNLHCFWPFQGSRGWREEGWGHRNAAACLYLWAAITALWFGRCHSWPLLFFPAWGCQFLEGLFRPLVISPLTDRHLSPAPAWDLGFRSQYLHRLSLLGSDCL